MDQIEITQYQLDAFTDKVFGGNPAAVCILDEWLDDQVLQAIAAENNLSETAFIIKQSECLYKLRWFTPALEVDLCGHATLASAHVIFSFLEPDISTVKFDTASGILTVTNSGDLLAMEFPSWEIKSFEDTDILDQALGIKPVATYKNRDLLAIFEKESDIRDLKPNMEILLEMKDALGLIVTAPGDEVDFVSRFFAPWAGIPEDPVTGSSFCSLIPYWSERLGKKQLHAYQISKRRGEVFCEAMGDRVKISGQAVLYSKGSVFI